MNIKIKNIFKSKKGQAFSTFQLLIAAVVALAILALLLPMITNSVNIGTGPSKTMENNLKSAPNQPGNLIISEEVKFSAGENPYINTSAIIEGTGIGSNQVAFYNNGFDSDFKVIGDNKNVLQVLKKETVKYKIATLCDTSTDELLSQIETYGLDYKLEISSVNDLPFSEDNVTVCIIYPIKQ
jgi:hypothetical protein